MTVIFIFPLSLSFVGAIFFLFTEISWFWKLFALGMVGTSIVLQFAPSLEIHFLVPLFMQLIICLWVGIYWQIAY
jgi:hypothetical protein